MPHQTHKWKVNMAAIHSTLLLVGAKCCALWRWPLCVRMPILPELIKEGGVYTPTKTFPHPWRQTHMYTYAWRTTRSKTKHARLLRSAHLPEADDKAYKHALPWMEKELLPKATEKETYTHAFTWNGPPLIECFLFQNVIGNLILIKVFRAQAYIPSYKQKHARTLTDSNLKQPRELIYKNVYNTETQGEITYNIMVISLHQGLHTNMGTNTIKSENYTTY